MNLKHPFLFLGGGGWGPYIVICNENAQTRDETESNRLKKKRKKNENRTRGDRRAPDASPSSWTGCLLSFPFESCSFFYELTPRERVPFSNASRVSRKSSVLRRARNNNNNNNNNNTGHASTRASFVVGKSSSRGSARRTKRKSENFSRVREEETEIQTKKLHAYALESTRNRREKSTPERLGRRQRTRRTVAETHIEQYTQTHTHTEREREGQTTHREK